MKAQMSEDEELEYALKASLQEISKGLSFIIPHIQFIFCTYTYTHSLLFE
jgi:hypothetical protein